MIPALVAFPAIGLTVMVKLWPYLWLNEGGNLALCFRYLIARGTDGPSEWNSLPLIHAIGTMPLTVLLLVIIGLFTIIRRTLQKHSLSTLDLFLLLWMIIPVLRVSIPNANDFDVIRHWMEFIPAISVIAGIGGSIILQVVKDNFPIILRDFRYAGF